MGTAARYWQLVKLGSDGQSRYETIASVKALFQQQFPALSADDIPDASVQRHLWQLSQDSTNSTAQTQHFLAALGLRCFISHQIEQVCIQLESQFGNYYGFTRYDLFPFVLDDDGKHRSPSERDNYQPLAIQVLQKFDPHRASLTTWTVRLVKHHRELNQFLLERGLCMLSDWAILNDTSLKKLRRVLLQFHHLTEPEVQQASVLLDSYHAVYRRDRILQGQKGQCPPPTQSQLQEIAVLVQQTGQPTCSATVILSRLHRLADRLRQHRISAKGGLPTTISLDQPEHEALRERLQAESDTGSTDLRSEFLQTYRQQFLICLDTALERVVGDRIQVLKPPKNQSFLTAMQLFHCQGLSMGAIALQIGLKAQYQVTRLLNLNVFRADVRHWMLQCLRSAVFDNARQYIEPDQLVRLDAEIACALGEQIDKLIQEDEANARTPKNYLAGSVFARRVCEYLDRLFALDQEPVNQK